MRVFIQRNFFYESTKHTQSAYMLKIEPGRRRVANPPIWPLGQIPAQFASYVRDMTSICHKAFTD
jgi:hypothetical protein